MTERAKLPDSLAEEIRLLGQLGESERKYTKLMAIILDYMGPEEFAEVCAYWDGKSEEEQERLEEIAVDFIKTNEDDL